MKNINFYSALRLVFVILILELICIYNLHSQERIIQIVNEKTKSPVVDICYQYSNKSGFSDENGRIFIEFADGFSLSLSHVQCGKIEISNDQFLEAVKTGRLKVTFDSKQLLPVTILQVHPEAGEKAGYEMTFQDKLEHDAARLLDQISSISLIRKSGSYGFDPVLRGFKYDQLNLVLDGSQSASAACPNRMDPAASQIPVNMISTVEVLKGPYSFRMGNAFGGTINFKSSLPEFSDTLKGLGRLGTSYESNGNVIRTEGFAGLEASKVNLKMFGSYSQGNDYTDGDGVIIPSNFNRLNWGGKMGFKLSKKQNMSFMISNNRAKNVDFPSLPMDLRNDNTWLFNLTHTVFFYNRKLSSWRTTGNYTKVNHLMDNIDKVINPRTTNSETKAETWNYGGHTELRFDFKNTILYTGADYHFESADGYRSREILMGSMAGKTFVDNVWQDAQIQRTGFFGEFHTDNREMHFVLSARLDYNSAKANNPDSRFAEVYPDLESAYFNPSVSVGGTRYFSSKLSSGLWVGSARRSPGISERYINFFPIGLDPYEMVGNPQLNPETNNQADLVFKYKTTKSIVNIDLFSSFLRNFISSEINPDLKPKMMTSPGVRRFMNIDKALIYGFEFEWNQVITRFLKHDFAIFYTHGKEMETNEPLPEIPPLELKYRLTGNFANNKVFPEIQYRQAFSQNRVASSFGETETPAFSVFDFKLLWLLTKTISLTGGVLNMFDAAYYEHLSRSIREEGSRPIYSPGRSFYVTLTFNFQ